MYIQWSGFYYPNYNKCNEFTIFIISWLNDNTLMLISISILNRDNSLIFEVARFLFYTFQKI